MSSQAYRIEHGLVVNGPITADNIPGAVSDLTDVDLGETGPSDGDTLLWSSDTSKWEPGAGSGASYWTLQAGESPTPDLIYTQYKVGIGTFGDQNSDFDLVVNGDTLLGDVKISGTSLIGDGGYADLGDIKLVPNEELISQGQYVKIRPTTNLDQTHIHIEAGDVDLADLYLGDDDRYVKIDHTGPVTIGVPGASTTSNWTADSDATETTYISIVLTTYPWAIDLTIGDTIMLPDESSVTISNAYFGSGYAYINVDSPITYVTSDVLEFTYQPRSEWSFKPDSSAEFPGDLTATSFIGDGSELTGIDLTILEDVDTTTLPPSTGQGLLWDGLTSKWRPGNVGGGSPGSFAPIRQVFSPTTSSIPANGTVNLEIEAYNSYALMEVFLDFPSRCRLYTDNTARADDAGRSIGTDPNPGSGLIAEVVSVSANYTQKITPWVVGGNLDDPPSGIIYLSITNLSGSERPITISLTLIKLEA
jgi:hypothetical protein